MQKHKIPFQEDSSVASATTSKASTPLRPSSAEPEEHYSNNKEVAGSDLSVSSRAYLSYFAADGSEGDIEPLPLEETLGVLVKRERSEGNTVGTLSDQNDEFLGYERVKRRRY